LRIASPGGRKPQVGWGVHVLTQLMHLPTMRTTRMALPVGTGKAVE